MPPGGYHGQSLHVRLEDGSSERKPIAEGTLRAFLGGSGLGTKLLLDAQASGIDPLAPGAAIAVALSPLVGSPLTTSAKFAVVAKSPLTNTRTAQTGPIQNSCRSSRTARSWLKAIYSSNSTLL